MQPEFSLILPVYNVAPYLARCLESILVQDVHDCEIILVDDGSTDASPAICDEYAEKHQEVSVIHKANGGAASARNAGLEAARGRYIWFIDSDDWIASDSLSILRQACSEGHDIVKFSYVRVEGENTRDVRSIMAPGDYAEEQIADVCRTAFRESGRYILSLWSHVYRREMLHRLGIAFVSERQVFSEDFLLNLQILPSICSMRVLDRCLYNYEVHVGSLSFRTAGIPLQYTELYIQLRAFYAQRSLLEQYERLIDRYYVWSLIYGSCFYSAYTYSASDGEARRAVREMLAFPEFQSAIRRSDRAGLSCKKRILLAAMAMRMEWVFHYLFVTKPARNSQQRKGRVL